MKIQWIITESDKANYRRLIENYENSDLVRERIKRNVKRKGVVITIQTFWEKFIGCLVTTQQRSGRGTRVDRFLESPSQLLNYKHCSSRADIEQFAQTCLSKAGLRRGETIAGEIKEAVQTLGSGRWKDVEAQLRSLIHDTNPKKERDVARFLQKEFKGIGPKQSRNLIQWLGISQHEIPLDSRMIKVLESLNYPIPLGASALSNEKYYCFVEDSLHSILSKINVLPCVFDACVFASLEKEPKN